MNLLVPLAERLSVIVTVAFLMSRSQTLRRFMRHQLTHQGTLTLILIFGAFGIAGTYSGIPVSGAIANSRAVGAVSAGLLGGPKVGLGAGLIAGLHRYLFFGGFTGLACAVSTTLEGLLGGLVHKFWPEKAANWKVGTVVGMFAEIMQMVIILLMAKPYDQAKALVDVIALPMILVNGAGVGLFLMVIKTVFTEEERIGALQAQKVLNIADLTLPYLRTGLNSESAEKAAQSIYQLAEVEAVALTDYERILAHVGMGSSHHRAGQLVLTEATRKVLETGQPIQAVSEEEIHCSVKGCPLRSAVVVPLRQGDKTIGVLKLYRAHRGKFQLDLELAEGLGKLFSTQLELAEVEHQKELRTQAEIQALQAQIHPHFLFNVLNTVISLIRTQPEKAREVLIFLGQFLRHNMRQGSSHHTIREELEHVQAYLAVEMARFGPKLHFELEIDEGVSDLLLPPLVLQPLVENAIKHGLLPKENGGTVRLSLAKYDDKLVVKVSDDGVGIPAIKLRSLLDVDKPTPSSSVGLKNVHQRLKGLYGQGLEIESIAGQGTTVHFEIPARAV